METGDILRIIICCGGVGLLGITISSLAKRRMTEPFCLTWGIISVVLILAGILLRPTLWNRFISMTGMFLVLLLGFAVIYIAFFVSTRAADPESGACHAGVSFKLGEGRAVEKAG